jgi:hypothetical protein
MTTRKSLRRSIIGTLLTAGIASGAIVLPATARADNDAPSTNTDTSVIEPVPIFPLLPSIDPGCRRQLFYFDGRWHCG